MLVDLECKLYIGDKEILIQDEGSMKAVVGTYENDVTVTFGSTTGRETYLLNKDFAEKLGKALLEKSTC